MRCATLLSYYCGYWPLPKTSARYIAIDLVKCQLIITDFSGTLIIMNKENMGNPLINFLTALWHDLRYGGRMIRRNLGFSIAAIAILALGIAGNTAIFTITSAVLLKPLSYRFMMVQAQSG